MTSTHDKDKFIRIEVGTPLHRIEEIVILKTLGLTGDDKAAAARILGISERTLHRKLKEYCSPRPTSQARDLFRNGRDGQI
jgi:DNA-binding NtrC family response regulator